MKAISRDDESLHVQWSFYTEVCLTFCHYLVLKHFTASTSASSLIKCVFNMFVDYHLVQDGTKYNFDNPPGSFTPFDAFLAS